MPKNPLMRLRTLAFIALLAHSPISSAARPDWRTLGRTCNFLLGHPSGSASPFWLAFESDPILKERSHLVQPEMFHTPELRDFIQALANQMFSHITLAGFSAPQVRVSLRIFVLRKNIYNPFSRQYDAFINPTISPIGLEMAGGFETCLSVSGICRVERYRRIAIEYFTAEGLYRREILEGVRARMAQHENDHLDGVLIGSE